MEEMLTTNQQTSPGEACPASRRVSWPAETGPENPQASYYRARYYDPAVGRFLSEDRLRSVSGPLNFYGYVENCTPNLLDPTVLCPSNPNGE